MGNDKIDNSFREERDRYAAARTLLAGANSGWTVDVVRKKPKWAKGHCERIEVSPDGRIDFEELKDDWGGKTLMLSVHDENNDYRGCATIDFFEPPKKNGVRIYPEDLDPAQRPETQPQKSNELEMMERMMTMTMANNKQMLDTVVAMMTSQQSQNDSQVMAKLTELTQQQPQQLQAPESDLEQLDKLTGAVDKLETIRERLGGGSGGPSTLDFALQKAIEGAVDMIAAEKKAQLELQKARFQATLRPPLPERTQPVQVVERTTVQQETQPSKETTVEQPDEKQPEKKDTTVSPQAEQLMNEVASMKGNGSEQNIAEMALAFRDKLSKMPPEQAEQTTLQLLNMVGFQFEDDEPDETQAIEPDFGGFTHGDGQDSG